MGIGDGVGEHDTQNSKLEIPSFSSIQPMYYQPKAFYELVTNTAMNVYIREQLVSLKV